MLLNHYQSEEKRVGYIMKIQEVDFNGIVVIIWEGALLLKIKDKLKDEEHLKDI